MEEDTSMKLHAAVNDYTVNTDEAPSLTPY